MTWPPAWHKLLVLRYNPDAFKIAGVTRRTTKKERHAQLGELLAREPEAPFTRLFLFYDRAAENNALGPSPCAPCPAAPRVPKFEAGKPGGESVSASVCTDALTVFSGQSGRRVWGRSAVHCAPRLFRDKPKGWYAAEVLWKQGVVSSSPGPAAGGRRRASLSLLRFWKAGVLPRREVRGVDAFESVANLHRCYLRRDPVFLRSLPPGGAQQGAQEDRVSPQVAAVQVCDGLEGVDATHLQARAPGGEVVLQLSRTEEGRVKHGDVPQQPVQVRS